MVRAFRLIVIGIFASALACCVRPAAAQDQVKLYSEKDRVLGSVDAVTPNEIVVNGAAGTRTIPASDVEMIFFGETPALQKAQLAYTKGDFKESTDQLSTIRPDDFPREVVRTEVAYMQALVPAKIALSGQTESDDSGDSDQAASANKAIGGLLAFLKKYPKSYHYYDANETIGDLAMSIGRYDKAEEFYQKLNESPSADLKARANLLRGRAMQVEGKYDQALEAYDAVLKSGVKGKVGTQELIEAKVGRTYSLTSSGRVDEAIKTLKEIIEKADDDDTELLARAYDALGNCYRKQKDSKQALWAYLRVDSLYHTIPEPHAEALANLVVLWTEAKRSDRAREARDFLQQHYPYSRWNKLIK